MDISEVVFKTLFCLAEDSQMLFRYVIRIRPIIDTLFSLSYTEINLEFGHAKDLIITYIPPSLLRQIISDL